jgi:hypothetical protein
MQRALGQFAKCKKMVSPDELLQQVTALYIKRPIYWRDLIDTPDDDIKRPIH